MAFRVEMDGKREHPGHAMNLGDALSVNARRYPDKTAIVVDGETRDYRSLNARANQLANALLEIGLRKGDLMGILSPNSVQWAEALYAIFKIGAVAVPINYRLLSHQIIEELKRYGVATLFLTEDFLEVGGSYQEVKGRAVPLILLRGQAREDALSLDSLILHASETEPRVEVDGNDVALIMFTGGTTGLPKGVPFTHDMLFWTTINYMVEYDTPRTDHIMFHPFPIFHTSGMYRMISYIWAGATYLTLGTFDPERCLDLIEKYRANAFIGSSAVFVPMLQIKRKKSTDTSSVNLVCATFAFMDEEGRKGLKELFPNARVYEGYGFTEGGAISALRPDQRPRGKGSVGMPGVHTKLKIVDELGEKLGPGKVGEIAVKGPHIPTGYYNNDEETRSAFKDGWFHTGDMGKLDEDGFLYMVDRKKDMIKTGGENVYSREVEEALLRHPDIHEVAVIGVPHERWGETIKAIVVTKRGARLEEQEVIDFCRQHLASYKKPTSVDFVENIPKTDTGGKISKWKLREMYNTGHTVRSGQ